MATIKAVLKSTERKTDRTHLVLFRLTVDRKAVYIGTAIYLPKKHWNPDGTLDKANWVTKANPLHKEYNDSIKGEWLQLDRLQLDHPDLTAAQLKALHTKGVGDLLTFFRAELEHIKQEVQPATYRAYHFALKQLEAYGMGTLDTAFLKRFEAHLLKEHKRNTVSRYLSTIKTLTKRAVEAGLIPYADNPFLHFVLKKGKVHKDRLTAEEVATLIELRAEGLTELARRAFLVQFFLQGMRISDLLALRWEQVKGDRLEYKSQKTGTLLSVRIPAPALPLLGTPGKGYIFPFLKEGLKGEALRRNQAVAKMQVNRELKTLATLAGIPKVLSSHVARHTFASLAWASSKDVRAVSQALGHTSLAMTQAYLRELTHAEQDALSEATYSGF